MGDLTDAALVEQVQKGHRHAFDLLVARYQHRIINLVSRFVRDRDEAMDVAQEVFIKAYRSMAGFRGESAFYTWLYRIAINTAKNHLTAGARRPRETELTYLDGEEVPFSDFQKDFETPEALLQVEQMKAVVLETINSLPSDLKEAIMLREIDGLSYEEIAHAMDCPVGTVRSRIFRAREVIDEQLKPLLER